MIYECGEDEVCVNTPGSYDCQVCPSGYVKKDGANYCSQVVHISMKKLSW